jgi:hypothetical protein
MAQCPAQRECIERCKNDTLKTHIEHFHRLGLCYFESVTGFRSDRQRLLNQRKDLARATRPHVKMRNSGQPRGNSGMGTPRRQATTWGRRHHLGRWARVGEVCEVGNLKFLHQILLLLLNEDNVTCCDTNLYHSEDDRGGERKVSWTARRRVRVGLVEKQELTLMGW